MGLYDEMSLYDEKSLYDEMCLYGRMRVYREIVRERICAYRNIHYIRT